MRTSLLLVALLGCGAPSRPPLKSIEVDSNSFVLGTGADDLWGLVTEKGSVGGVFDRYLVHFGVEGEEKFLFDVDLARGLAPAEPGTIWVVTLPEPNRLVVKKLDVSGAVLLDRSEDFEVLTGDSYEVQALRSHGGALVLSVATRIGQRFYRFDGEKFVRLMPPASSGFLSVVAVRGLDDIWFARDSALVHYRAGLWQEVPGFGDYDRLNFDETGIGWMGGSGFVKEQEAPFRTLIVVQRVADDELQEFRFDAPTVQDDTWVPLGAVARPGGQFALLGKTQRADETSLVAFPGDSNGFSKGVVLIHRFSNSTFSVSLQLVLADGSVVISAGAIAPGRKLMLIARPADLP